MVIVVFRLQLPFIYCAAATRSLDPIFRSQMFRKELMNAGDAPVERERAFVADSHGEAGMNKTFPKVRIKYDVPDSPFLRYARHHPVEAQAVAWLFAVFRHRFRARTDISAVARQDNPGKPGFPAEFVHQIRTLPPVRVDKRPLDLQNSAVLAFPLAAEQIVR